ncbi:MAG: hypothetical protein A2086_13375 [Spirochaetes bacterium GWD1_27_9]|nr:MAG: hypothetical protein A2Z98_01755 [Spirochaetes bacterium GWB1_27_13]OHD25585.1 MAG: hypothetical protein A2Y34_06945 [Spirochaetes bacterium GWC1_27_15]OHD45930.1 MAG: hypothetical protein A2086_13375 [Spirochaetes bacterium GWD1_27_9]
MPPLANHTKIMALFKKLNLNSYEYNDCVERLKKVIEESNVDNEYLCFRYQIFKSLCKIIISYNDLIRIIAYHDIILKSIIMISEEDITGYHHYYSIDNIKLWINISNNIDDFIKIINSKSRDLTAKKIAIKNNKGKMIV